jgi:hypothetical protein
MRGIVTFEGLTRALIVGAVFLGPHLTGAAAIAQEKACTNAAECLAQQLISTIPPKEKIALRPFLPKETSIPAEAGKRLYSDITKALFDASGGRHKFIGRGKMDRIWKIWEAQFIGDFAKFIAQSRATVEIVCDVAPHSVGIELSCSAFPLDKDRAVAALAVAQQAFPLKSDRFQMEHGLADIARRLAVSARGSDRVGSVVILNTKTAQQSELTAMIGGRAQTFFNRRQAERRLICDRNKKAKETLQTADGTRCGNSERYVLRGKLWWLDDKTVELVLSLSAGAGNIADERVRIDRTSLPERFRERDYAKQTFYNATAVAFISRNLDRDSAERAARNLARARVVAQALGIRAPSVKEVRTEADGVFTLGKSLNHGIPVAERPTAPRIDGDRLEVELQARVLKVGSTIRPAVKARLERVLVQAMEPLRIKLAAEETVHLGVFSWGSDNKVVRLYPNRKIPDLVLRGGERLTLPREGEDIIVSAPLPVQGNVADHEALIVLAASTALDFEKLAAMAGDSLVTTAKVAVTGALFFDRLAKLDLSRLAVIFLPYQVSKDERRARRTR